MTSLLCLPDNCERVLLFGGVWAAWYLSLTSPQIRESIWTALPAVRQSMPKKIFVVGGHGGRGESQKPYSKAEVCDARGGAACTWETSKGPCLARTHGSAIAVSHYLYVLGGRTSDCHTTTSVERLDFYRSLEWECAPSLASARHSAAALCISGSLYILGGFDGVDALDTCEELRHQESYVNSDSWCSRPPLSFPRGKHAAVTIGSSIYLLGGMDSGYRSLDLVSCGDFSDWSDWTLQPPMQQARSGCAAAVVLGAIVVVGGVAGGWTTLSSVERFQPQLGHWETMAPMQIIRRECAAIAFAGELWVLGGASYGGRSSGKVEVLREAGWELGPSLMPRSGCAAVFLRG
ncbi:KLHL12 [Symbiodinium natans]|uniref:KLHL12 protein n=1 Tax=Symbiodinium natans TaxID=878477 RepID=A0A812PPQ9_9DINO|nr:KLHL12 [Symbiodinium natans]